MKRIVLLLVAVAAGVCAGPAVAGEVAGRRLEVLFVGAPGGAGGAGVALERYRVLKKQVGVDGINLSYVDAAGALAPALLANYDAVLVSGAEPVQLDGGALAALVAFVENGGGLVQVQAPPAGVSDGYCKLLGARPQAAGAGVVKPALAAPEHPLVKGWEPLEANEQLLDVAAGAGLTPVQVRGEQPFTWVRSEGKGRVVVTGYGSELATWGQPGFHELLRRALVWAAGDAAAARLAALRVPVLETEEMLLPGYRERRAITRGQKPLAAAESLKLAQVPVGYQLSLFASDPDIVNPIYVNWDHRGRAYVIETVDYPNNLQAHNLGHDRIKICEDSDGDGRADKFTVFADKLSIPTALVFVNGGVVCTNGSQMIFLKDSDGDDKADVRQVLFEGFGMGDTHAGVSNLRYGFDHWIYATVGYSGFNGTVGGEPISFSSGVFRFKPDGSKLEYLQATTNNTWGLGFTSDFDVMGSTANGNPSWYFTFPRAAYQAAGLPQPRTPAADDNPKFFPSSMDIRQVDVFDGYTAAAGHGFYTSTRFPKEFQERSAFVTEPTGKLVGNFAITRRGAGFAAHQEANNLYSSADAWSAPVQAETGPDGAVWVSDWYNIIIQHNPTPSMGSAGMDARTGRGNAYETPLRDVNHGRIYRIYPKGSKDDANPGLDPAKPQTLLAALGHPNLLWRLHAQRLLIEANGAGQAQALKQLVSGQPQGAAALHAFHVLQALGQLDAATVDAGLRAPGRGLRRAALASADASQLQAAFVRDGVVQAADARELAEVFAALARVPASEPLGRVLYATLVANQKLVLQDTTVNDGWQMAARRHAAGVLLASAAAHANDASGEVAAPVNQLPNGDFEQHQDGRPARWSLRGYVVPDRQAVELAVVDGGRTGKALRLSATKPSDVAAGINVPVKPGTRYRLGGWVRTENVEKVGGRGVQINVHQSDGVTLPIAGTNEWTELTTEFATGNNETGILVQCLLGGWGSARGTAYFDDLYLLELGEASVDGSVESVASHFAAKGDAAARAALIAQLKGKADAGSKQMLAMLDKAAAADKPAARKFAIDPQVQQRGLAIYSRTCVACHGPDGKGVGNTFPPLDGSKWLTGEPSIPVRIVTHGLQGPIEVGGQRFDNVMPAQAGLTDAEVADVLSYARQAWSNDAAPVSAEEVKAIRTKFLTRDKAWTPAELK